MRCIEYHAGAFDNLLEDRFGAGLSLLRSILEYGIRLSWCSYDKHNFASRFEQWEKEAARQRKCLYEAWRDVKPQGSPEWRSRNQHVLLWQSVLNERSGIGPLPMIGKMADELRNHARPQLRAGHFYPAYRMLCEHSHAVMDLDALFEPRPSGLVTRARQVMPPMAPVLAAYVPLVVVDAVWEYLAWDQEELSPAWGKAAGVVELLTGISPGSTQPSREVPNDP